MKQILFLIALLWISCSASGQAGKNNYVCRLGFTYEISRQQSWGYNKPVILSVAPLSPAAAAGLKANDIIVNINGTQTEGNAITMIDNIIQNSQENVALTVLSLGGTKEVNLQKDCKQGNAITESQLAEAYSFYSLENSSAQAFSCPFKTTTNPEVDYVGYKSFGFSPVDLSNEALENMIYGQIKIALEQKGLVYNEVDPDLIVNTYYSYNKNLNYRRSDKMDKFPIETRYNVNTRKMESLPIYFNPLINSNQAEFLLSLGVRLIDRNKTTSNSFYVVWECEANEMLQSNYGLDAYAKFHIPLILMQFPYPKTLDIAKFKYKKSKFDYTGLNYNINDLMEVVDIDYQSPAYREKMLPGDVVERVNLIKTSENAKEASEAYKHFIYKTMPLRDPKTQFTNAEGFTRCMYWDPFQYTKINEEFKRPEYFTSFSYLFYFEPYINMSGTNIITFDIKRGRERLSFKVKPIVQSEEVFETY